MSSGRHLRLRPFDADLVAGQVVPVRSSAAESVEVDDRVAFYDGAANLLVMLNPSAAAVWQRCDGSASFDQIVAGLGQEFEADPALLRRDAWRTLCKLAELGLVRETGAHRC